MENGPQESDELESLEAQETDASSSPEQSSSESAINETKPLAPPPGKRQKFTQRIQGLITHVNIYLLLFALIILLIIVVIFVSMQRNKKAQDTPTITTQELTQEDLDKISENTTKVGDPKQTLSIESNAIFSGKVLVRSDLDVAGTIKVGGAVNLPGITVSGTSSFDQVQANRLSVAGDTNVQGTLSIQKSLTVAGGATFGGPVSLPQLSVQSLQLNGDLTFTRHIDAGGPNPGSSNGAALGGGGTASVSGTDSAGTVTINTGSGPGAGCFVTITFNARFNTTPHVVITPVGSAAASLDYYINRTSTGFSICTTNPAPAGQNFAFDYIVIE